MKKYLLYLLCLILFFGCKSKIISNKEKVNVLFIGNSLTYFHDMPKTLQSMLNETHQNFNIEQSAFPGYDLNSHLEQTIVEFENDDISTRKKENGEITETEKKIISKNWDIIIIQEHPSYFYFPEIIKEMVYPNIQKIKNLNKNPNCIYLLFDAWVLKGNYPKEIKCIPESNLKDDIENRDTICSQYYKNYRDEVNKIELQYTKTASSNLLINSNICKLHYEVSKKYPNINLYEEDAHPSESGSFLNACIFYKLLTHKKVSKLKFIGVLDTIKAKELKIIVDTYR